jgi:hypothetical protein
MKRVLSRKYILTYTGGRVWATSDACSFAEALQMARVHGLDPEDFRRGERILGDQITSVDVAKPLCARRLADDASAQALAEHYLGAQSLKIKKEVSS